MLDAEEIDAISVATPEFQHRGPVVAAAEAGKHVFVEKPIAHTIEDALAMAESARGNRIKLMVGYLLRFDPRYVEGKRQIKEGAIGEILSVWARRAGQIVVPQRVAEWCDPLFYMSVHDIDLINWYIDSEVERVYAEATMKLFKDKSAPDVILALMRYKDGATASLEVNWCRPVTWQYPLEARLHVTGTRGTIYGDIYDQGLNIFSEKGHLCPDSIHWPITNNRLTGDLKEEMHHFLECVILDKEPLVTGEDGINSLRIALAIAKSISTRKIVYLRE